VLWIYALGAINLAIALYSLWASFRYRDYARRSSAPAATSYRPSVALLVPCRGAEEGLEANLAALASQDYPQLKLVFIVESHSDPALPIIERVRLQSSRPSELVVAGPARACGQKVHNLLSGLSHTGDAEVLAFADSDGRPDSRWLARLVAPLEVSRPGAIGVATGYRFYIPEPVSFATLLRAAWNASVLTLLGEHDHNFAWGGSMAIRRAVFEEAGVARAWQGALSDDYALTHAVRRAGYRVEFVPGCLVGSEGKAGFGEVAAWSFRQLAITRVYWPPLWLLAGGSQILYAGFLVAGGLAAAAADRLATVLLGVLLGAGFSAAGLRARAVEEIVPTGRDRLRAHRGALTLIAPLAGLLTVYAFVRSALTRRIEWRGKLYEMRSPTETLVLDSIER
jgi:hypothetical protein